MTRLTSNDIGEIRSQLVQYDQQLISATGRPLMGIGAWASGIVNVATLELVVPRIKHGSNMHHSGKSLYSLPNEPWWRIRMSRGQSKTKPARKRYYRKRLELLQLIDKIKIWPSRKGLLHGIKAIESMGNQARITTHCNKTFMVNNSRNSRAARWLRNKWFKGVCPACGVPEWKLEKYASTHFRRHHGSSLSIEGGKK